MHFKIDVMGLPETFGNQGDSSIVHLDNIENECSKFWKDRGAQEWGSGSRGKEGRFVGFIVSQDSASYFLC